MAIRFERSDALLGAVGAILPPLAAIVGLLCIRRQPRHVRVLTSGLAYAGELIDVILHPVRPVSRTAPVLDLTPEGPRFVLPAGDGDGIYALRLYRRGMWTLGPAIVRHADAFGMAWVDDAVASVSQIAVAPRPADVTLPRLSSEERESVGRTLTSDRVVDPATVRDYRPGDPRRLVHWRASLRRDRLMVRGDRPRGHADLWLVVDTVVPPPGSSGRIRRNPLDDGVPPLGPQAPGGVDGESERPTRRPERGTAENPHGRVGAGERPRLDRAARVDLAEDALAGATGVAVAAMRAGHRVHLAETGRGRLRKAFEEEFAGVGQAGSGSAVPAGILAALQDRGLGEPDASPWLVLEPTYTTESLLRMMARLTFDTEDNPGWQAEIIGAAQQIGSAVAVIAAVSHITPGRLAALADVSRGADPSLGWSPDPSVRSALTGAGLAALEIHLTGGAV
ncbi:MAG: DUF58 domain-containing protein [Bifidobacteriaceae bacterium]|nr:DUF58 domain-containing protein [Bifidobacteriaceae bacterium]